MDRLYPVATGVGSGMSTSSKPVQCGTVQNFCWNSSGRNELSRCSHEAGGQAVRPRVLVTILTPCRQIPLQEGRKGEKVIETETQKCCLLLEHLGHQCLKICPWIFRLFEPVNFHLVKLVCVGFLLCATTGVIAKVEYIQSRVCVCVCVCVYVCV